MTPKINKKSKKKFKAYPNNLNNPNDDKSSATVDTTSVKKFICYHYILQNIRHFAF